MDTVDAEAAHAFHTQELALSVSDYLSFKSRINRSLVLTKTER